MLPAPLLNSCKLTLKEIVDVLACDAQVYFQARLDLDDETDEWIETTAEYAVEIEVNTI